MESYAVIMAGGTGTRLWPLSTKENPKQTHKLIGDLTLFQEAVRRVEPLLGIEHILVVAGRKHVPLLKQQEPGIPDENFIVEPKGMGTAPCIGLAAIHLANLNPESIMIVLTADHYIGDVDEFQHVLEVATKAAEEGPLVTLGIKPNEPSTGYGYIEHGDSLKKIQSHSVLKAKRFTEKPDSENASKMVKLGNYSWNSGMFIWKVSRILEEFRLQMPILFEQLEIIRKVIGTPYYNEVLENSWQKVPRETIDYGVMENALDVAVIPIDIDWSDLGTWSSLMELLPSDSSGNAVKGKHLGIDTNNCLIFGGKRTIGTIGVNNLVIVETDEAILVCDMDQDQKVKELVNHLEKSK
jgi:mannose-1-phosphate guanylyltransferase